MKLEERMKGTRRADGLTQRVVTRAKEALIEMSFSPKTTPDTRQV